MSSHKPKTKTNLFFTKHEVLTFETAKAKVVMIKIETVHLKYMFFRFCFANQRTVQLLLSIKNHYFWNKHVGIVIMVHLIFFNFNFSYSLLYRESIVLKSFIIV